MGSIKPDPEPIVTAVELEKRWRALQAVVQDTLGDLTGHLRPGPLVMIGLGLAAVGGALWLQRGTAAANATEIPEMTLDVPASTDVNHLPPSPANPRQIGEAVLRGLAEGLIAGGILPGMHTRNSDEESTDA